MGEIWRQAAEWLKSLGVLSESDFSDTFAFAMALQDGTVLCNAANKISPGCIQGVSAKPTQQFMKMQNIAQFIDAMTKTFGLKESQVFSADALYYASNFAAVVATLSALSRTKAGSKCGSGSFPTGKVKTPSASGQEEYASLQELVHQNLTFREVQRSMPGLPDDEQDDIYVKLEAEVDAGSDDIYKSLVDIKRPSAATAMPSLADDDDIYADSGLGPDARRNNVMDELLVTEENYVRVLKLMYDNVKPALQKSFSAEDIRLIFGNLDQLLDAHNNFLRDMQQIMAKTQGRVISDIFMKHMRSLRCYGRFCCNIPDATARLRELESNKSTSKILESVRNDSGQKFAVRDLLNVPMQRVLKYPLLVKELLKRTPDQHPDKLKLPAALTAVEELARFIDQSKQDYETLKTVSNSLKAYGGKPLHEFGKLIKDGDLHFRNLEPREKEKMKPRYAFLLSNAIIIAKQRGSIYNFKKLIELSDDLELKSCPFPPDDNAGSHTFAFGLCKRGSERFLYVFAAVLDSTKKQWMKCIQERLDAFVDERNGPPEVLPRAPGDNPASAPLPPVPTSQRGRTATASRPLPPQPAKQSYETWVPSAPGAGPSTPSASTDMPPEALDDSSWYAGRMDRARANKVMAGMVDGAFLVRESVQRVGEYSLSIMFDGEPKHIKINRSGAQFDIAPDSDPFSSVAQLVANFRRHTLNRHFPGIDTTLRVPFREAAIADAEPPVGRARSRYPYQARNGDELTFDHGMELVILSKDTDDPGWWRGRLPDGSTGLFPANFVQPL